MLGSLAEVAKQRFDRLLAADIAAADFHQASSIAAEIAKVRSFLEGLDVQVARRVRELATSTASAAPADVLDNHGRRSRAEARAAEERARACDELPGFDDALATGAVSAGHVDAIARATKGLDDTAKQQVAELAGALLGYARPRRSPSSIGAAATWCAA